MTFIYTRCPLPTSVAGQRGVRFHPRRIGQITRGLQPNSSVEYQSGPADTTAPVLRKYGLAYLGDDPIQALGIRLHHAIGSAKLATAFGFEYFQDGNQIAHTMSTILIAPDGTVAKNWSGPDWKTPEVLAAVREAGKYTANLQPQATRTEGGKRGQVEDIHVLARTTAGERR